MPIHRVSTTEIRKNDCRKRFTDKQISFLEYMFETESKPELRMKHHLANKLGLHPRQVAIWFQNKRARSKSRQIEQEYNTLKHEYEKLALKSESLKKENRDLIKQLEMLRNDVSSGEESDYRVVDFTIKIDGNVMLENYSREIDFPVYDSVTYFGETSCGLGPDLQEWWEF